MCVARSGSMIKCSCSYFFWFLVLEENPYVYIPFLSTNSDSDLRISYLIVTFF
ncbi:hypothetical protein HanIR_Chr13g0638551 [Helianthus annuus]|nr:hypothetical protein HanIR_Chr13g0638551 [Helianthus annuus]